MRLKLIPHLQWSHIRATQGHAWEIRDPERAGLFYTCPAPEMRIICDWANGIDDIVQDRPFIPCQPLGMKAMPLAAVKRSIAGYKHIRQQ